MSKSVLAWGVLGVLAVLIMIAVLSHDSAVAPVPHIDVSWNGTRAMGDIATQLSFGPRALGSPGHEAVLDFIHNELAKTSASIIDQKWPYRTDDGKDYAMTNVVARFDPSNPHRVILGTHYDSIVRAYRDKNNPDGIMPGANNSASGVALLLETARTIAAGKSPPVGIDMVFFDGEEGPHSMGAGDPHWVALGSPYFAEHLGEIYPDRKPAEAVIFDMVCYKDMKLRPELFSLTAARRDVRRFWHIGETLAPWLFKSEPTPKPIGDDQVALANAGIPSFLVIGFEYEPWFNTTQDTIDKCAPQAMEGLGKTLLTYLYEK